MKYTTLVAPIILSLALIGCGDPSGNVKPDTGPEKPTEPEKPDTGPEKPTEPEKPDTGPEKPVEPEKPDTAPDTNVAHKLEDLSLCLTPTGLTLTDINSVVEWVNAMPKPLTLACFLASLPRPMEYNATLSTFSAQPSIGQQNPRIFINYDKLWLSVVPQESLTVEEDPITKEATTMWDEDNIQLLELSFEVDTSLLLQQTLKAELAFPIFDELAEDAPYSRVMEQNKSLTSSICGLCHGSETIVDRVNDVPVFRSEMLRNKSATEVNHAYMVNQHFACDPNVNTGGGDENNEWYRCQMLDAIYDNGAMIWHSFPKEVKPFN